MYVFGGSQPKCHCNRLTVTAMQIYERIQEMIERAEREDDRALLQEILEIVTPREIQVARILERECGPLVVIGALVEQHGITPGDMTQVSAWLQARGYERRVVMGVRCHVHPRCEFPKAALVALKKGNRNEQQPKGVPRHDRVQRGNGSSETADAQPGI